MDSDYLIVGAGPAGLQLGYHLDRAGRDYRILEAGPTPGTFFRILPRHRQLISINKRFTGTGDPEFNLRMDWNSLLSDGGRLFTTYTTRYFPDAADMVRYLTDYATATDLKISFETRATRVERHEDGFTVTDQHGEPHPARRLIVATGPSRPYIPNIPGIELADGYESVSVAPEDLTDQRVLIIGKGNSAFETADNLVETAAVIHVARPHSIRMSWQSHYVGHLRAVNNNFLDTCQLKSQNALLDGHILISSGTAPDSWSRSASPGPTRSPRTFATTGSSVRRAFVSAIRSSPTAHCRNWSPTTGFRPRMPCGSHGMSRTCISRAP